MTVIAFTPKSNTAGGPWSGWELDRIVRMLGSEVAAQPGAGWHVGATDCGDPQFYVVGPPPEQECVLCISRLGPTYILEDGMGRIVLEHDSIGALAREARKLLSSKKAGIVARISLFWCALRHSIEEKFAGTLAEGEELLGHIAPQLVALI